MLSCPFCRRALTVPTVEAPTPLEAPDPFSVDTSSRDKPRYKPRQSAGKRNLLVLIGVAVSCVVGAGIALSVRSSDHRQQLQARTDEMVVANRALALTQQVSFWLSKDMNVNHINKLLEESQKASREHGDMEEKMKARWGSGLKLLKDLDPERGRKLGVLTETTEKLVGTRLKGNHALMVAECEVLLARLYSENPVKRAEYITYDLSTAGGRQKAAEQDKLLPAKDKVAEAERELLVVNLYNAALPGIQRKWVNTSREQCQADIAKLEEDFRKP